MHACPCFRHASVPGRDQCCSCSLTSPRSSVCLDRERPGLEDTELMAKVISGKKASVLKGSGIR